jgi:hypothetical protein
MARFARREGECGSFFGLCPKNEPPLLLFCERSYERFQRHHALGVSKKDAKTGFD